MDEHTVPIRDGAFETQIFEAGCGSPLLFLHGVSDIGPSEPFLQRLSGRYHVIAPHLPGFGESSGSEQLLDLHDLIYYELDLLDALGLRDLPLIGHSLGGMIAAELAAVQPERFSALVLLAPFGIWNPAYPVADFFSMPPVEVAAATYHNPASPAAQAMSARPADNEAYIAFMLERAKSLATAAKYLWPIPNRGLNKRLHRVAAPTLLIWGESDGIVPPQYAGDFRAGIPQARVQIIPEAGHLPQFEQTDRVVEAVEAFLSTVPAPVKGGKA
jgi:pimeloyl-ACP methyl ester carboxylesterase